MIDFYHVKQVRLVKRRYLSSLVKDYSQAIRFTSGGYEVHLAVAQGRADKWSNPGSLGEWVQTKTRKCLHISTPSLGSRKGKISTLNAQQKLINLCADILSFIPFLVHDIWVSTVRWLFPVHMFVSSAAHTICHVAGFSQPVRSSPKVRNSPARGLPLTEHLSSDISRLQSIKKLLEPSRMIDFCKLFLIVVCYLMLTFVDTSMVYHIIRGQAIIKLYIFFNMLEARIDYAVICSNSNLGYYSSSCLKRSRIGC